MPSKILRCNSFPTCFLSFFVIVPLPSASSRELAEAVRYKPTGEGINIHRTRECLKEEGSHPASLSGLETPDPCRRVPLTTFCFQFFSQMKTGLVAEGFKKAYCAIAFTTAPATQCFEGYLLCLLEPKAPRLFPVV